MRFRISSTGAVVLSVMLTGFSAQADEAWYVSTTLQSAVGDYAGSLQRESFVSGGVVLSADYLERAGLTLGYTRTHVSFVPGISSTEQDALFGSGRIKLTPDGVLGTLTLRLDGHYVDNNDLSGNTDNVGAIAPLVSFLPYSKKYYVDLGYAHSVYQNNLKVDQLTPTLGLGLNDGSDWLQLRGFLIKPSNASRAQGKEDTLGLEGKWTHWLAPGNLLWLDNARLGGMVGERIYTVDPDGGSLSNLADVQKGGVSFGAEWRVSDETNLLLMASHDWYENLSIADPYRSASAYFSLTREW